MILKQLSIKEGLYEKKFCFDDENNLIYSNENSSGKTTLLRSLLYAMGYRIPETKHFKFNNCEFELTIKTSDDTFIKLIRVKDSQLELISGEEERTYVLPEQEQDVLSIIYNTTNRDLLNNILGTHYFDQEKGWTLLNRGTVIGSIHFNIEELIRGLEGIDCSDLIEQQKIIRDKIEKYKQIQSIIEYKKSLEAYNLSLAPEESDAMILKKMDELTIRKNIIESNLKSLGRTLRDNQRFKKYVSDMNILIRDENGKVTRVTEENIIGLNDSIDFLIAKRKILTNELVETTKNLERLLAEKKLEDNQLEIFKSVDQEKLFDINISRLPINENIAEKTLKDLKQKLLRINEKIKTTTKVDNASMLRIMKSINKYAQKLNLEPHDKFGEKYLFTSNLKELSGAVLHKTVFAFKLAYILEVQSVLGVKLPIILDSPSGKEVDRENIQLMMDILKEDFAENQIIIASIYKYHLPNVNIIELKDRMMNS